MILFPHIIDDNLGDSVCCPARYFSFEDWSEIDFRNTPSGDSTLVIGGGGMLYPGIDDWISTVSKQRKVILWGVGLNYHNDYEFSAQSLVEKLKDCVLVGVRDRGFAEEHGFDYVPCPSCMLIPSNPLDPVNEIGVYEHFNHPIPLEGLPRMNNRVAYGDAGASYVLNFLSSCKKVITNSYHGAYWTRLLNREVEIYKPFSNRFSNLPEETLVECKQLNQNFYEKVIKICYV